MEITYGLRDRQGRQISLRQVGEDWREVADVAPRDDQRQFVCALAARYLLLSDREGLWRSLGIYADEVVVGHVMWAEDEDGSAWIGGLVVDAAAQGLGIGRVATQTLIRWFSEEYGYRVIRLSYQPENVSAARVYESLGFQATGERQDDEIVAELRSVP
jgi:diamine N-acetyltransferase